MFYTINSSPMLVTKSVFKLIFVLSNYQTWTFPLRVITKVYLPFKRHLKHAKKIATPLRKSSGDISRFISFVDFSHEQWSVRSQCYRAPNPPMRAIPKAPRRCFLAFLPLWYQTFKSVLIKEWCHVTVVTYQVIVCLHNLRELLLFHCSTTWKGSINTSEKNMIRIV